MTAPDPVDKPASSAETPVEISHPRQSPGCRAVVPPALVPPLHNLPAEALLEKLIADYVFALLTEAAFEALASENAARFAAMASAHDNVSQKLDQLRQDARQARQEEITTELLDLVTGAEALRDAEFPSGLEFGQ